MSPRVKICGIRSTADLTVAVTSGADAIGFICGVTHRSEDALAPEQAAMLVAATPPYVSTVLVTHLELAEQITGLAELLAVDTIQVHGLVTRKTLREVFDQSRGRWRITRAVHVTGDESIGDARHVADSCHAVHLDSRTADRLGGTGRTHNWSISRQIVAELCVPVVLSGGLCPNNVAEALEVVQPYAVDVNSGIENEHGDKDISRALQFVNAVRQGCPGRSGLPELNRRAF